MAFYRGMANQRLKTAIRTEVSHIQLHIPEFEKSEELRNYIDSADIKLHYIKEQSGVEATSKRLIANAIINSAEKGSGIRLLGVVPEEEAGVTDIKERLQEGTYLDELKRGKPIVIGQKLSEILDVKIGSKLVTAILDINGQPSYFQFRVGGIFHTASNVFDETNAFIRYEDFLRISGMPDGSAHEIAIYIQPELSSAPLAATLKVKIPMLSVRQWNEILPELGYLTETMDLYMYIFIIIILLALGFGIVNTMLMVVLERIRELGMLMAIGMNKLRVFKMIMLETVVLSLTGGVLGIIAGIVVAEIFSRRGIDLSGLYGEGFRALGYDSVIYTAVQLNMITGVTILVILTGILSSVFPALKALKLKPAEAVRIDV